MHAAHIRDRPGQEGKTLTMMDFLRMRRKILQSFCLGLGVAVFPSPWIATAAAQNDSFPSFVAVQHVVQRHLSQLDDYRPGDLIARRDIEPIFRHLEQLGWDVADRDKILKDALEDQNYLVTEFRTQAGKRLMRKISGYKLVYDRFDRIAGVYGGKQLIHDLAKLPDGERYAKQKTRPEVPDLLDLLPKRGSGQTRTIKDYDKPTGRIYTADQLLARLRDSHTRALEELASAAP